MTALEVSTDVDTPTVPARSGGPGDMEHWLFHEDGPLSEDQARVVTAKASSYAAMLYRILGRAHERQIWTSLGYGSWHEYVTEEFDMSRSRAYQLVGLYESNNALAATSSADTGEEMSEAQARPLGSLKSDPQAVRQIWERAKVLSVDGDPTATVMAQAVAEYRDPARFVPPLTPLTTARVRWVDEPLSYAWRTYAAGTHLEVWLGDSQSTLGGPLFKSDARIGPRSAVIAADVEALLPWVVAELMAGGSTWPDATDVDDLSTFDWPATSTTLPAGEIRTTRGHDSTFAPVDELDDDEAVWEPVTSDVTPDDTREVLRGEVHQRDPKDTDPVVASPATAGPSDGPGASVRDVPGPSTPRPSVTPAQIEVIAAKHDLADFMRSAAVVALNADTIDVLDEAAQIGRAFASWCEDRKAQVAG